MSPTDDAASAHTVDTPYQLFMLALCVWALAVLAAGSFAKWDESTRSSSRVCRSRDLPYVLRGFRGHSD